MKQTRWQCADCRREWLFATHWNEINCPTCGSPHVTRVTYTAAFPGADIGTRSEDIPVDVPTLPPTPAIDPKQVQIEDNRTLRLVEPMVVDGTREFEEFQAGYPTMRRKRDDALARSSPEFE